MGRRNGKGRGRDRHRQGDNNTATTTTTSSSMKIIQGESKHTSRNSRTKSTIHSNWELRFLLRIECCSTWSS